MQFDMLGARQRRLDRSADAVDRRIIENDRGALWNGRQTHHARARGAPVHQHRRAAAIGDLRRRGEFGDHQFRIVDLRDHEDLAELRRHRLRRRRRLRRAAGPPGCSPCAAPWARDAGTGGDSAASGGAFTPEAVPDRRRPLISLRPSLDRARHGQEYPGRRAPCPPAARPACSFPNQSCRSQRRAACRQPSPDCSVKSAAIVGCRRMLGER